MKRSYLGAVLGVVLGSGWGTAEAADIVDTAAGAGTFTKLLAAVEQAGLTALMRTPGPFTVFAPNDAAFAALPPEVAGRLMDPANKAELAKVLSYHVVAGRLATADVKGLNADVKSLTGQSLVVNGQGAAATVNGAAIIQPDIQADNGAVHVIDKVLIPPTPVQPKI
ncbi:MAG: fasciclin domain-containing protein [Rhizobiales bacterium]|nr:fasciclin domain-containing protein [Hyphomicrobiales bacterium]